jgi:quinohemoprotein amine dehydrogenase
MMVINGYAKTPFDEKSVVRQKCSVCHKLDDKGKIEVIEETRKSPEEWKSVVIRMIHINGAPIEDTEFNLVIKDLSKYLSLTPSEMAQIEYYTSDENSQYVEYPIEFKKYMKTYDEKLAIQIFTTCKRCHAFAKIASHKKTLEQWTETRLMHLGYYPTSVPQMREMDWPKAYKDLLPTLHELFPFESPEWETWMKNWKDHDLSGNWKVAGYQPGFGYYEGKYTIQANSAMGEDEYIVQKTVRYENGLSLTLAGEGTLYSGYHLRYKLAPTAVTGRIEGVFNLDAGKMGFTGKWWTEVQDTNAYGNESFYKSGGSPIIFAAYPQALKAGVSQTITLVGVNLPKIAKTAVTFPDSKIEVQDVTVAGEGKLMCKLEAKSDAPIGVAKIAVNGAACEETVKVYKKIDAIKVMPAVGRARVSGGAAYPPEGVQFVARGVSYGADGKPDTADDLILEPVNAKWSLEEQPRGSTGSKKEAAEDFKYLQSASIINGLYTPTTSFGPIKERFQHREGTGLIAVAATCTENGSELKAKAQLAVCVPDYVPHIK